MNVARNFYSAKAEHPITLVQGANGTLTQSEILLPVNGLYIGDEIPAELQERFGAAIETLYSSIKPATVNQNGAEYTFELGHIPATAPDVDGAATLRAATYQSSLTGNKGNGFEVAADAVFNPAKAIGYVASIGMGLSTGLTSAERTYLKRYGRLLVDGENGEVIPLPVVSAFNTALKQYGLDVDSLYSDSAGAILNMAYGAAYGDGHITTAHQNVRTGIFDRTVPQLLNGTIRVEGQRSGEIAKHSTDAIRMRQQVLDFTNVHLGADFESKNYKPKKSVKMLGAYAVGLGKGPNQGDPLLADSIAFVRANPEAKMLFTAGRLDPLAEDAHLDARMQQIVQAVSAAGGEKVMAAVMDDCSHSIQTHYPQFLRTLAKVALQ